MSDEQTTFVVIGYIDASTHDLAMYSPLLEEWAKTASTLFWVGSNEYLRSGVSGQLYLVEKDPETRAPTGELIPVDTVSE